MKNFFSRFAKSPLLWGGVAAFGFYAVLDAGAFDAVPLVRRYVARHEVEYVTTVMFFIALAALLLRVLDVWGQLRRLGRSKELLGVVPSAPQPAAKVGELRERIDSESGLKATDYLRRRLDETLDHVERQGSAERLDEQLRYLSEMDAVHVHESHSLFRLIVWAIPILGFLGTVMGITLAIANLDPSTLEESMDAVTVGLASAFDTTALALALSLVLMFCKFLVDNLESRLLSEVDRRADVELLGRFETELGGPNGELVAMVRRTVQEMVQSTEGLVKRQIGLWQESLATGEKRWSAAAAEEGRRWQSALKEGLAESFRVHSEQLIEAEKQTIKSNHRHWSQVQERSRTRGRFGRHASGGNDRTGQDAYPGDRSEREGLATTGITQQKPGRAGRLSQLREDGDEPGGRDPPSQRPAQRRGRRSLSDRTR